MNQLTLWMDLLICFFEMYIYYDFQKDVFHYRSAKRPIRLATLLALALSIFAVHRFNLSFVNLIATFIILAIGEFLLYRDSYKSELFFLTIYFTISAGAEVVTEIIFGVVCTVQHIDFMLDPYHFLFIILTEKLFALLILRLVKSKIQKSTHYINPRIYRWVFILPATTIFLFAGFAYSEIDVGIINAPKVMLVIGCFCLLCANALVFYLFEKAAQIMSDASEMQMQNMKLALESKHYERVEEINQEHRNYIHDISHYFGTIRELIAQKKDDEALQILSQMSQKLANIDAKEYCQHPILNAVLCDKSTAARQNQIRYEVSVAPSINLSNISDLDLISMLSNLIDNAIEAASKVSDNPYVTIDIFDIPEDNSTMIQVENPYVLIHQDQQGNYTSSKKDKFRHGIGLQNVRNIVKKNNGILTTEADNGVFHAWVKI